MSVEKMKTRKDLEEEEEEQERVDGSGEQKPDGRGITEEDSRRWETIRQNIDER